MCYISCRNIPSFVWEVRWTFIHSVYCTVKSKAVPQQTYGGARGGGGKDLYLLFSHDLGTRWRCVVSFTPRPPFSPRERTPGTHCTGGWVGPTAGLDTEVRGKIHCFCRRSNLDRLVVHPVARHYTDWATRLTFCAVSDTVFYLQNLHFTVGFWSQ
jgi:hypothetical protein